MNFYPHHISDFNNSTRHLTRVERSVYRDAIELYYDTEQALTSDIEKLSRRLLCASDEEKEALNVVLDEFFIINDSGFSHVRCDSEIEKYRANSSAKARAGKASAEARRKKRESLKTPESTESNTCSTAVEQSVNEIQLTNNHEPITNNQLDKGEKTKKRFSPPSLAEVKSHVYEKGYGFDPDSFLAHYKSNGWRVGKNKMKCWKSACVTWNNREGNHAPGSGFNNENNSRARSPGDRVRAQIAKEERDGSALGALS